MTQVRDLEKSLRNILSAQLRELVNRCVPKSEWADREQIRALLDKMINAWVNASPETRPAVLSDWLERISSHVDSAKAVKGVRAGKSLPVSSRLSHFISHSLKPGGIIRDPRLPLKDARLPFDLLKTKLNKLSFSRPDTKKYEGESYEVASQRIAELLNLSKGKVEVMRKKLRSSGLDVSLLNAKYIEASRKNSGKSSAGSKQSRGD